MPDPAALFDPAPAAAMLATAWRADAQIAELPPAIRPSTLREGYDVQDRLLADLGERIVGWKLGVGSPNGMRNARIDRALIGRVVESRCFAAGATIALRDRAPLAVEIEIGFVLGRDVAPGSASGPPMELVDTIRITCEIVRSRFVDRRAVGWPSFVADDSGFRALVVGDAMSAATAKSVSESVAVRVDGREAARAAVGDDRTDPLASLMALLAHASDRGITLRKGDIVSTGSASKPFDLAQQRAHVVATASGIELGFRIEVA